MRLNRMKSIGIAFKQPFDLLINDLYLQEKMSSQQISDYVFAKCKILITPRSIQRQLKKLGIIRNLSDAFNLAIGNGRKSYDHLR